ncbi:hypothetical protein C7M84_009879 [Penaeus vannamei]|uniref:Uncharacterized protein n=1 Tax=Penaeus vannamei TaxID=6689 RepID=A0A3R7Q9A5_PENVA|nr:hypothetical protein C7M84_009879 [Penaeus vannamei]
MCMCSVSVCMPNMSVCLPLNLCSPLISSLSFSLSSIFLPLLYSSLSPSSLSISPSFIPLLPPSLLHLFPVFTTFQRILIPLFPSFLLSASFSLSYPFFFLFLPLPLSPLSCLPHPSFPLFNLSYSPVAFLPPMLSLVSPLYPGFPPPFPTHMASRPGNVIPTTTHSASSSSLSSVFPRTSLAFKLRIILRSSLFPSSVWLFFFSFLNRFPLLSFSFHLFAYLLPFSVLLSSHLPYGFFSFILPLPFRFRSHFQSPVAALLFSSCSSPQPAPLSPSSTTSSLPIFLLLLRPFQSSPSPYINPPFSYTCLFSRTFNTCLNLSLPLPSQPYHFRLTNFSPPLLPTPFPPTASLIIFSPSLFSHSTFLALFSPFPPSSPSRFSSTIFLLLSPPHSPPYPPPATERVELAS